MMSDVIFKYDMCKSTGWMRPLKKALYNMNANDDRFSLLVFWKAGREEAILTDYLSIPKSSQK